MSPQASRAYRPDSTCRSRVPQGSERKDGPGFERSSYIVKGILFRWRRDAIVRPLGPAPMIAMDGILMDSLGQVCVWITWNGKKIRCS